jgi:hypothetical protein
VNSALTAKVHPNSPQECEVSVVEIGPEVGGVWQPQLALLYDTQQGLARVRWVYGYFARPNSNEPAKVLNVDEVDHHVGFYLVYQIVKGIVSSGLVTIGITTGVDRFGVQPFLTNSKAQVQRTIETVRNYTESPTFSVPTGLSVSTQDFRDEMKRLLLAGQNILQLRKLFVDRTLAPKAWDWSAQTLRANADHNDTRLSFVLERSGQSGLHLERWGDHFAILKWHRDGSPQVVTWLDSVHLDVKGHQLLDGVPTPDEREGLRQALNDTVGDADVERYVTVAVYDLMNSNQDKVKVVDGVSGPRDSAQRKSVQTFHSIGLDFGGSLLSIGPKVLMDVVDGGINLLFNKRGVMILYDRLEESEAELFASLNSRLSDAPDDTRDRLRIESALEAQNMNLFAGMEGDAHANRTTNAARMTTYLQEHGQQLCEEVDRARDTDFRAEYLTSGERNEVGSRDPVGRLPGVSQLDGPGQRAALIKERLSALEARRTLRLYDPEKYHSPKAPEVRAALATLAVLHDRQDVTILGQVLHRTAEEGVMTSALEAMAVHGDAELSDPIAEWLGAIEPRSRCGASSVVSTALKALNTLNRSGAMRNEVLLMAVQDAVGPFADRGVGENRELAIRVLADVQEQLTSWRSQDRKDIQAP